MSNAACSRGGPGADNPTSSYEAPRTASAGHRSRGAGLPGTQPDLPGGVSGAITSRDDGTIENLEMEPLIKVQPKLRVTSAEGSYGTHTGQAMC